LKVSFPEFFKYFWEKISVSQTIANSSGNKEIKYCGENEKEKLLIEEFMKLKKERREERKKGVSDKHSEVDNWPGSPFISPAEDLLKCLKEGLISKLTIISTTLAKSGKMSSNEKFKQEIFAKTFAKFPNVVLDIMEIERINNQNKPHR
jgi:hypothetical protein